MNMSWTSRGSLLTSDHRSALKWSRACAATVPFQLANVRSTSTGEISHLAAFPGVRTGDLHRAAFDAYALRQLLRHASNGALAVLVVAGVDGDPQRRLCRFTQIFRRRVHRRLTAHSLDPVRFRRAHVPFARLGTRRLFQREVHRGFQRPASPLRFRSHRDG